MHDVYSFQYQLHPNLKPVTWTCEACRDQRIYPTRKGLNAHLFHYHGLTLEHNKNEDGEIFYTLQPLVGLDYEVRKRRIQMAAASKNERSIIRQRTTHIVQQQKHSHTTIEGGVDAVMTSETTVASSSTPIQPSSTALTLTLTEHSLQANSRNKEEVEDWFEIDNIPIEDLIQCNENDTNQMIKQYRVPTPDPFSDMTKVTFLNRKNILVQSLNQKVSLS